MVHETPPPPPLMAKVMDNDHFFSTSTPNIMESQNLSVMHCNITDKVPKVVFAPSSSSFVETIYLFQLWY